jgi:hypothetical protein
MWLSMLELGVFYRAVASPLSPFSFFRGVAEELPHELMQLETGAMARVLKTRLDDGRVVYVPGANIELE